ncbi:ATPase [Coleofasciculus sp. FACHB-64]|uniref:TrkH family potassium uptake protein n=1 Tax=Cyanophyceae TaxID=3028117 RepID=UPI001682E0B1|nr:MULTISPECIES: TrkH family potassium uptake protein [unclassified Coleofasciculus]MBD1880595.1 ATPase [Coleofasciculus sp. FACHB-T130]MBD1896390.1 ATPase [Coleofasciculus sp. FACHB-129]MBD1902432.1 ATPase [Coleofasciculus sp. FACHB-125]MBD1944755.1 ATPase [Coleofasciculus sp. FACHB-712]MBD2045681.1 ATPase [Coleofasciculus sp. FACHB-64]
MTVARTICLGFLALVTLGTILLMLPFSTSDGSWSNPIIALFTATSAVCVTGLSVVDVGKFYSFWGQLFLVLLVQVGGLGYMTATTCLLLLLGRKFGLRDKIAIQQSLDKPGLAGVVDLVRSIIATTLIIEITGIFLLMLVFVPDYGLDRGLWLSIFHSVNAFNNAGFGLFSDNLMQYVRSPLLNLIVTALIILGGIGYEVIMEAYLWTRDRLSKSQACVVFSLNFKIATTTTLFLLILGTILFLFTEFNNPQTFGPLSFPEKLMAAWFQSVTPRTAGFNTIDIGKLTEASLFITVALMFIGTNPGSTGGGIKTTTTRVLLSSTFSALQGKEEVVSYQRQIPKALIVKATGVTVGSLLVVIGSTTLIAISDPQLAFIQILLEVVSAFATVGLSTGITASISVFAKLVLIATMYIGRVGVLLLMSAILGNPSPSIIRYPEENLLVG